MNDFDNLTMKVMEMPSQVICTYYEDKKLRSVGIDLNKDEQIGVSFEKGFVVVRTQTEVKFMCKSKAFVSLWR